MSKHETYLNEISEIVMATEDKHATLDKLEKRMSKKYQSAINTLKSILNSQTNILNSGKNGLWQVIYQLSQQSKQSLNDFISQYKYLSRTQINLIESYKVNLIGYSYIILLTILFLCYYIILKVKILPVFGDFFNDFSAFYPLPASTQFVMSPWFLIFFLFVFFFVFMLGGFIPWRYRKALAAMRPIPAYLRILPMYYHCTKLYNRYLWLTYSNIYNNTNEDNPLQQAKNLFPHYQPDQDEELLLQTAYEAGNLSEVLQNRQAGLVNDIAFRIKTAEGTISGLILLLYSLLIAIAVIAMYAPIFILGDIVG